MGGSVAIPPGQYAPPITPPPTLEPTADRLRAAVREGVNGCVNE